MNKEIIERDMSGCEKMIMKIVWDSEKDLSTAEVIGAMKERFGKDYARTTVVTFIQRLIEKGYVTTYRKGKQSYVHAIKNEESYTEGILKHIEEFWFKGETSRLFSALCKSNKPSKKELEQMRKIMDELDD